jgi:hypothetical protein
MSSGRASRSGSEESNHRREKHRSESIDDSTGSRGIRDGDSPLLDEEVSTPMPTPLSRRTLDETDLLMTRNAERLSGRSIRDSQAVPIVDAQHEQTIRGVLDNYLGRGPIADPEPIFAPRSHAEAAKSTAEIARRSEELREELERLEPGRFQVFQTYPEEDRNPAAASARWKAQDDRWVQNDLVKWDQEIAEASALDDRMFSRRSYRRGPQLSGLIEQERLGFAEDDEGDRPAAYLTDRSSLHSRDSKDDAAWLRDNAVKSFNTLQREAKAARMGVIRAIQERFQGPIAQRGNVTESHSDDLRRILRQPTGFIGGAVSSLRDVRQWFISEYKL